MGKKTYEFADLVLTREWEQKLLERETKAGKMRFKICSKCQERKVIFRFNIDKRNKDGRTSICKNCRTKESLAWYYQNRERVLIQVKEYQSTKDRIEYFKNYRTDHLEHLKKEAKKYYRKNRKRIKKRDLLRKERLKNVP